MSTVIYFNKSRDETDQKCARACYWNEVWGSTGIEPVESGYALAFGQIFHTAVHGLAIGQPVDTVAETALRELGAILDFLGEATDAASPNSIKDEQLLLMKALIYLFPDSFVANYIRHECEVMDAERDIAYRESRGEREILFSAKPDLLVKEKATGRVVYIEYKTTGYFKEGWFRPFTRSPQLFGASLAVRQTYGLPLDHVIVQPVNKGSSYKGKWDSPLVYLWHDAVSSGHSNWSAKRPSYFKGWERVYAGDYDWDTWLALLKAVGAAEIVYPKAPPIYVHAAIVENWWEQRVRRRLAIADAVERGIDEDVLISTFPQNFAQCEPAIGYPCDFLKACWIPHVGLDPLKHGYEVKVPHSPLDPRMGPSIPCDSTETPGDPA